MELPAAITGPHLFIGVPRLRARVSGLQLDLQLRMIHSAGAEQFCGVLRSSELTGHATIRLASSQVVPCDLGVLARPTAQMPD